MVGAVARGADTVELLLAADPIAVMVIDVALAGAMNGIAARATACMAPRPGEVRATDRPAWADQDWSAMIGPKSWFSVR